MRVPLQVQGVVLRAGVALRNARVLGVQGVADGAGPHAAPLPADRAPLEEEEGLLYTYESTLYESTL